MSDTGRKRARRILAVDYGDRRTGLAGTDHTGSLAVPLEVIVESDPHRLAEAIATRVLERESELVLVGLPLAPDGGLGARGTRTRDFARLLAHVVSPVPVEGIDERHTTGAAHERLKEAGMGAAKRKRKGVDAVAALVLVESWLSGAGTLAI